MKKRITLTLIQGTYLLLKHERNYQDDDIIYFDKIREKFFKSYRKMKDKEKLQHKHTSIFIIWYSEKEKCFEYIEYERNGASKVLIENIVSEFVKKNNIKRYVYFDGNNIYPCGYYSENIYTLWNYKTLLSQINDRLKPIILKRYIKNKMLKLKLQYQSILDDSKNPMNDKTIDEWLEDKRLDTIDKINKKLNIFSRPRPWKRTSNTDKYYLDFSFNKLNDYINSTEYQLLLKI